MAKLINLPHTVHEATCYINGLFDHLAWRGGSYDYFLLPFVGGMANFSYLKFKKAQPPCMVYWGNNPKYLLRGLGEILGFTQTISEGKSFKNELPKIKRHLDNDEPVMAGALDMYYLPYYPELYKKEHVPIHYILVVGYDDEKQVVYVHDCSLAGVQTLTYEEFEKSLDVNVPGMSRKNTYRVFNLPEKLPGEREVASRGFARIAGPMLRPPASMFGIPAMRKLAREITGWTNQGCYHHMVAYAGLTPPLIAEDLSHNDGMRFELARVLEEMGQKYREKEWGQAATLFRQSGESIISLCKAALSYDGRACAGLLDEIAATEEAAYKLLE